MNPNEEPKVPVRVYKRTLKISENHIDKELEITLNVYDEPVVKTQSIFLFNNVVIMHGFIEWGHGFIADPIPEELAESALDEICKSIAKYKNHVKEDKNEPS